MACQRVAWPGSSQLVQVRKQKLQRGLSHGTCVVRPSSGRENETCVFLLMSWVQNKKPASADAAPENRIFEKLRPFKSQIFCAHAKKKDSCSLYRCIAVSFSHEHAKPKPIPQRGFWQ